MQDTKKGLEDVLALDTSICSIDGRQGILKYRGIEVERLEQMSYDAVSYLLIYGKIPDKKELDDYSKKLRSERYISSDILNVLNVCNYGSEALDSLRTAVCCSAHMDTEKDDSSMEANMSKSIRLVAKFPTLVASVHRYKTGQLPIAPDENLSHGANFLYMLKGKVPTELEADAIEKDFILSAEHELNPSTFSLRITASTMADIYSAVITGLCTLKGPLHGGARKGVMNMLDEVSNSENAEKYVLDKLLHRQKVMGFGHRVYKTCDPRAKLFKDIARQLADEQGNSHWYDVAENLEHTMYREFMATKGKPIFPNVDFYSAVVYKYLDIPPELATSVFATGRVSGWVSHYFEQYANNRVIRPRANYI
ncbi:MAG: citrate/2-methylcitrate synthase [Methanolobus sp.]|uniref:citrate/2-methylcitrate synthase n=1 Tax=Methanolobus sp. TaxID=1874737 RepID=UPI0027307A7F|nr:citrate/2-methylcitrate synthase [Methanolobus sp.]MDP2215849.1 citrate/2-methylcitrate synthase [Methanolobus sp.]